MRRDENNYDEDDSGDERAMPTVITGLIVSRAPVVDITKGLP